MINCPKCQVPNPDSAKACAACGTTLVGQQLAQALEQALGPLTTAEEPKAPAPAAPVSPFEVRSEAVEPEPAAPLLAQAVDPAQAQAEINKFMLEQRARRRTKRFIWIALLFTAVFILGFLFWRSERKNAQIQEIAKFFMAFRQVDDNLVANFFKCTVRAKHRDVRLASNTLELTDGLEKAFENFPSGQPDYLRKKCIPMIDQIITDLGKLKPPSAFADPLEGVKHAMKEVGLTFTRYADTINQRKQEAANEQEVRNANNDFHLVVEQQDAPKALPYYNLLKCAIPDLPKMIKKIAKPPDTQPVVEYIYNTCKADPKYADKLRKECFDKLSESAQKTGEFRTAAYRMSGDTRDLEAINDCFRRANSGFAAKEYKDLAEVFVKYREARGKILEVVGKFKEKARE